MVFGWVVLVYFGRSRSFIVKASKHTSTTHTSIIMLLLKRIPIITKLLSKRYANTEIQQDAKEWVKSRRLTRQTVTAYDL